MRDAADHLPGIVVLLCDDGESCRWGLAMTAGEYAALLASAATTRTETPRA